MSDSVSLSQEQATLLDVSVQPAIDILIESGEFVPTLYVHDGQQITFYNLVSAQYDELQDLAKTTIRDSAPNSVAYVLVYSSDVETEDGVREALIAEVGDEEDDEAHVLLRWYSRDQKECEPDFSRLGAATNLLK